MVITLASVMLASSALEIGWEIWDQGLRPSRMEQIPHMVRYLQDRVPSSGSILVWGYAPEGYDLSGLRPASRYIYSLPLLSPRYADDRLIDDFLRRGGVQLTEIHCRHSDLVRDSGRG